MTTTIRQRGPCVDGGGECMEHERNRVLAVSPCLFYALNTNTAMTVESIAACSILPVRNKKGTRTTVEIPD